MSIDLDPPDELAATANSLLSLTMTKHHLNTNNTTLMNNNINGMNMRIAAGPDTITNNATLTNKYG